MKDILKSLIIAMNKMGRHKRKVIIFIIFTILIESITPILGIRLLGILVVKIIHSTFLWHVFMLMIAYAFIMLLPSIFSFFREKSLIFIKEDITYSLDKQMLEKVADTDLVLRKSRTYVDDLDNANYALLPGQIIQFLKYTSEGLVGIISCVGLLLYLTVIHWTVPILLSAIFISANYYMGKSIGKYWGIIFDTSVASRFVSSLTNNILSIETAKEIRVLGHYSWLRNIWKDYFWKLARYKIKAGVKYQSVSSSFDFLISSLPLVITGFMVMTGSVSEASIIVSIFMTMQMLTVKIFPSIGNISAAKGSSVQLLQLDHFLNYEYSKNIRRLKNETVCQGIKLQDITFSYPEGKNEALKNINLEIPEGSVVCIVGDNGSGKTTLVNIILGLFKPVKGKVIYGVNNQSCEVPVSMALFQNFLSLQTTILDNIRIGNIEGMDEDNIFEAIEEAKAQFALEIGLETKVGRQFGGRDLSGGEWQRVALARAFTRKHGILVLDEPTSAIDALAEFEIYSTVINQRRSRTIILVSHRLTCAVSADLIIVMRNGEIVEKGVHNELIQRGGYYQKMYYSQATPFLNQKSG